MHPLDIHWIYTLASVALVAGAALTGMLALAFDPKRLSRMVPLLVSLAAGALLGTAFGHLLPESVERVGMGRELSALLLGGFVTFFLLEKVLGLWCEGHPGVGGHSHAGSQPHIAIRDVELHKGPTGEAAAAAQPATERPMITNLLVGAGIHSFVDGLAIATGYITGTSLGVATTLAVLLHEVPHHIGDVSILIHKGFPVMRAVLLSLLAASAAVVGAILVLLVGTRLMGMTTVLLPFTTANFIYIAAASLMPELQRERGLWQSVNQTALLVAGSLLMLVSSAFSEAR
jgi:zinc and cadmium transporter